MARFELVWACLVLCLGTGMAPEVHAWGDTGHRIICEIAFQELNPIARAEVIRLIRLDPDFRRFSLSCIFPDHPRQRDSEHFVNLERSATQITDDPCPLTDKCIVTAIASDLRILSDPTASDTDKVKALKFLGHWVGDVHQPLHVSFRDDRGGNSVKEAGPCQRNLHAVWDTCMIEAQLGTETDDIATALRDTVTDQDRTEWTPTTPTEWTNESFRIAISPEVQYCVQVEGVCRYAQDNIELDGDEPERVVMVDEAYMEQHLPTIKRRLTQAGIRLGALLNQALGGQ